MPCSSNIAQTSIMRQIKTMTAELLKTEGNNLFRKGEYFHALSKYEAAAEIDSLNPVYFVNAANCHLKLQQFEEVLFFANAALELDPCRIKALFFRAQALNSLQQYEAAIHVCKQILSLDPSNPLAVARRQEYESNYRTQLFALAIHIPPILLTQEYIDKLEISTGYSGPRFEVAPTIEFLKELIEYLRIPSNKLPLKVTLQLVLMAKEIFQVQQSLVEVRFCKQDQMTICGDIHGQFLDFINIFDTFGYPSEHHYYLFNGDFVDRGPASIPCILTLLCFKIIYPHTFFMARGNHESCQINKLYGFEKDIKSKYADDENTFIFFQQLFDAIPLCHVIQDKIFVTHGGLPANPLISLEEIKNIDRFHDPSSLSSANAIMHDLCWSDPKETPGIGPNHRGTSVAFGPDITKAFLEYNNLELLVRSHEYQEEGFRVSQDGKCITIFSAPNYVNGTNKGAVVQVAFDGSVQFKSFEAVKEKI